MEDNDALRHSLIPKHRRKVKSGCRTCKLRKVKCDEGRPVCKRCSSTGRVCDGYGVWGGGGNFYGNRQQQQKSSVVALDQAYIPTVVLNEEEKRCFEWYQRRTRTKIPGLFVLTFWNTILIPASLHEPAVLHAVLALSSVHESGVISNTDWRRLGNGSGTPNKKEQFVLEHYTKAIGHLQSHLSATDRLSIRFALITCITFVCLEALRGRFRTALHHLESGLKVLEEIQQQHQFGVDDDSILQVFSRLSIQLALLDQNYQHLDLLIDSPGAKHFPCQVFYSFNEAWQWLECILYKILRLTNHGRQQQLTDHIWPDPHLALFENQQELATELRYWLDAYEASRENLQGLFTEYVEAFGCQLLYCYHHIAEVMVATCLRNHDDQSIFDSYTDHFVVIISRLVRIAADKRLSEAPRLTTFSSNHFDMSRSVVDIGWIPALYYVAITCRMHRLRLQAIKLLECSIHREGIWDARIFACTARKVMEIEERDFYKDGNIDDEVTISKAPDLQDLTLPLLPNSYRVNDVKVVLPNGPADNMFLSCRQRDASGNWKVIVSEYNMLLRKWIDT